MRSKICSLLLPLFLIPALSFCSQLVSAGFYAGASAGQSRADVDCDLDVACNADDTGRAMKAYIGNRFSPNLGAEFGYVDLGKFKISGADSVLGTANGSIKAKGFLAAGTGTLPLGTFDLFGKVGLFRWDADVDVSSSVGSGSNSASGTDPMFGVGAAFNLGQNLALRAEWERFKDIGDKNSTGQSDADMISVGLAFKF